MKKLLLLFVFTFAVHAAEQTGKLTGTIAARDAGANTLTVAHGDVPGLMPAMTMPYEVRGQKVTALPADGAHITATLHESDGQYWLTDVTEAAAAKPAADASMPMVHSAMPMAHGSMLMFHRGDWMFMLHGNAFVSGVVQSGPRGDDKVFATNWAMGSAERPLGGGRILVRSMLSLEPLTVGDSYPELFQTGETLHGQPIVDAQHPHDFVMELAAQYTHALTDKTTGYVYAAPVGEPALGPIAFPHRASAAELPQAPLAHHLQDATHIASSVLTLGANSGAIGYAISGFHGQEPDENRWDIDRGRIDSWSARVTFDPTPNWSAQLSTGHLRRPERLEPGDVQRTTASLAYNRGGWHTTAIFGRNDKREHDLNSWLVESLWQFGGRNYLTGRAELVDKDELLPGVDDVHRVKALTLGYARDVLTTSTLTGALGVNVTTYAVPDALQSRYGSNPHSAYAYFRIRLGG